MNIIFRIGEFANIVKISSKTLRYYDELGLLKPEYIDDMTGYRYYSAGQIPVLNEILLLKEIGLSLKEITYIIENDIQYEELINLLMLKQIKIKEEIVRSQKKLNKINSLVTALNEKEKVSLSSYKIFVKKVEPIKAACIEAKLYDYAQQGHLWTELLNFLDVNNIKQLSGCFTIYHDSIYKENSIDVEIVKPIAHGFDNTSRIKYKKIPGVNEMACLIHKGEHESAINSYTAIMNWIQENNYIICGSIREIYHEDDLTTDIPEDYITEIQIPITKKD